MVERLGGSNQVFDNELKVDDKVQNNIGPVIASRVS